mgnify:CR=1 FL=1
MGKSFLQKLLIIFLILILGCLTIGLFTIELVAYISLFLDLFPSESGWFSALAIIISGLAIVFFFIGIFMLRKNACRYAGLTGLVIKLINQTNSANKTDYKNYTNHSLCNIIKLKLYLIIQIAINLLLFIILFFLPLILFFLLTGEKYLSEIKSVSVIMGVFSIIMIKILFVLIPDSSEYPKENLDTVFDTVIKRNLEYSEKLANTQKEQTPGKIQPGMLSFSKLEKDSGNLSLIDKREGGLSKLKSYKQNKTKN